MKEYEVLERIIKDIRKKRIADPNQSYIAKMFNKGHNKIVQKFGEEAVELVIEAALGERKKTISEASDMIFHFLLLLEDAGIELKEVLAMMESREGISGLEEKKQR